jgi:tripartite-type tricarboxylate transporter receptor subunit TctC
MKIRFAAAVFGFAAVHAFAQSYPARPVRIVVPFVPGGLTDIMARVLAQKYGEAMSQQFIVENRGGAGGNIGMALVARAAPDGYTVLLSSSSYVVNPSLYSKAGYDFKDFAPVTMAASSPNSIVVHPSLPVKNVQELIALLRANPGKYSYAQPGTGTTPHLSGELFKLTYNVDIVNVPFNGAAPAMTAVMSNQPSIGFLALATVSPNVKSGGLRMLAIAGNKRNAAVPDVPTMAEAGAPGQEADTMQGIFLPAGSPQAAIDRLYRETVRIIAMPDVKEKLASLGFEPVGSSPEEFGAYLRSEIDRWAKVVRTASIRVD